MEQFKKLCFEATGSYGNFTPHFKQFENVFLTNFWLTCQEKCPNFLHFSSCSFSFTRKHILIFILEPVTLSVQ
jgi:hypothetical protein